LPWPAVLLLIAVALALPPMLVALLDADCVAEPALAWPCA